MQISRKKQAAYMAGSDASVVIGGEVIARRLHVEHVLGESDGGKQVETKLTTPITCASPPRATRLGM